MNHADILKTRTELSRQIGQKTEAMRLEAEHEALRCEGAAGSLAQASQALAVQQGEVKAAWQANDIAQSEAESRMAVLSRAISEVDRLQAVAMAQLQAARGRAQQAGTTLDLLESLFVADVQAAERAAAALEAGDSGRHPGPSLAAQRGGGAAADHDPQAGEGRSD